MTTVRVDVGGMVFELRGPDGPLATLARQWPSFITDAAPSVEISWRTSDAAPPVRAPARLPRVNRTEEALSIDGDGYRALARSGMAELESGSGDRFALESTMKILLAAGLEARGGLLVHGVGVRERGSGALFTGQSGAGKSTLGRNAELGGWTRLADEMVALWPEADAVRMAGTPWNLGVRGAAKVAAIGVLSWGQAHSVREVAAGEVLRVLLGNSVLVDDTAEGRAALFQRAAALLRRVRTLELRFAPDPGVVRALGEAVER